MGTQIDHILDIFSLQINVDSCLQDLAQSFLGTWWLYSFGQSHLIGWFPDVAVQEEFWKFRHPIRCFQRIKDAFLENSLEIHRIRSLTGFKML